ncbi:MAG: type 1 glutamine amidotransferase [Actinomycetes bacterium]
MTADRQIEVLYLYPDEMNIYGDRGNLLAVVRRLEWHGYRPALSYHHPGEPFPKNVDVVVGGGGQDSGQVDVEDDLQRIGDDLHDLADKNVPMLAVCGMYQLFGRFFRTHDGRVIRGIGIFDAETRGQTRRLVGNVVVRTRLGEVVGYENHSGQTFLGADAQPLGTVVKGFGNNTTDDTEGAVYKSVVGTYLHGSLLPKNPALADALIEQAAKNRFGEFVGRAIDDTLATKAREAAKRRPQ